jgi:chemotaxis protein MotB
MRAPLLLAAAVLVAGGCVTTKTYDKKVAELDALRAAHDKTAADRAQALQAQLDDAQQHLQSARKERDQLRKQLDDAQALVLDLKQRLEKLGQNVDKLAHEKGQLDATLADAKARLDELRKQKQAAEARAQTFRNLVAQLRSMIDAGQLKVVIRDGRMIIALPNDVLFDSGKTAIKPDGQAALAQVAQVLATIPDRHFLVAGDTDDVPIHSGRFPSNWELSTARAVEVVKLLVDKGVKPEVLAAGGYGQFDPIAPNDSPEHRAQNRRIEIVLQPNLADLPPLDDVGAKPVVSR